MDVQRRSWGGPWVVQVYISSQFGHGKSRRNPRSHRRSPTKVLPTAYQSYCYCPVSAPRLPLLLTTHSAGKAGHGKRSFFFFWACVGSLLPITSTVVRLRAPTREDAILNQLVPPTVGVQASSGPTEMLWGANVLCSHESRACPRSHLSALATHLHPRLGIV